MIEDLKKPYKNENTENRNIDELLLMLYYYSKYTNTESKYLFWL